MNKSNFAQAVYPYHSYETSKSLDFIYKDSLTAQVKDIFSTLDKFYESIANEFNKNYIIIEIGTYFGGFTKILSDSNLGKNSNGIYTFDIEDLKLNKRQYMIEKREIVLPHKNVSQSLFENCTNVSFHKMNIFSEEALKYIKSKIDNNKVIIFCDGGNKPQEFNLFSRFLKKDDFILAHDYSFNEETFNNDINGKIWYWLETKNSDIQSACNHYGLENYMEEDFNKCVWTCRKKK